MPAFSISGRFSGRGAKTVLADIVYQILRFVDELAVVEIGHGIGDPRPDLQPLNLEPLKGTIPGRIEAVYPPPGTKSSLGWPCVRLCDLICRVYNSPLGLVSRQAKSVLADILCQLFRLVENLAVVEIRHGIGDPRPNLPHPRVEPFIRSNSLLEDGGRVLKRETPQERKTSKWKSHHNRDRTREAVDQTGFPGWLDPPPPACSCNGSLSVKRLRLRSRRTWCRGCRGRRCARPGWLNLLSSQHMVPRGLVNHKRPYVGASRPRSWSHLSVLGAISWAFIAKY